VKPPFTHVIGASLLFASLTGCTPSPEATPSPTVPSTASATPSPSPEPVRAEREANIPDEVVVTRMANPRMGEVWHEPVPLDEDLELFRYDDGGSYASSGYARYFEIGTRGEATIVALAEVEFNVWEMGHVIHAVFEIDDAGARYISCPSARTEAPCISPPAYVNPDPFTIDTETFYDTLTLPEWITVGDGLSVAGWQQPLDSYAEWTWGSASLFRDGITWKYEPELAEDGLPWGEFERETGRLEYAEQFSTVPGTRTSVVRLSSQRQQIAGVTAIEYGIVMAHGGLVRVGPAGMNGFGVGSITWDDGATVTSRFTAVTQTCFAAPFTLLDDFDPDQWVAAGETADGQRVYLPVDGGNTVAHAAFDYLHGHSWGVDGDEDGDYPYDSADEFVEARSIFTYQLPGGDWIVAMDPLAAQRVYECA
jgi:hypothetical protein